MPVGRTGDARKRRSEPHGWMGRAIALRRTSLSRESAETQNSVIRAGFFPIPSHDQQAIVRLYRKAATSAEKAVASHRSKAIEWLLRQGQILSTRSEKVYLSDEGVAVAKGTLDIYPELRGVSHDSRVN